MQDQHGNEVSALRRWAERSFHRSLRSGWSAGTKLLLISLAGVVFFPAVEAHALSTTLHTSAANGPPVVERTGLEATPDARLRVTTRGRTMLVNGRPFFPLLAWAQCPEDLEKGLALGVNLFMGDCGPYSVKETLRILDGRAFAVLPIERKVGGRETSLLGWHYHDEPDGYGIRPEALPGGPTTDGRLRFVTVSPRFAFKLDPVSSSVGKEVYPGYFSRADVVGFDLYPLRKWCGSSVINLFDVYGIQRELNALARGKPTYQWIETGPMEGECLGTGLPVTPKVLRAEVWLAIAGGASGIGYFTHTRHRGRHVRFDVRPALQTEIARLNEQITELARALLAERVRVSAGPSSPVKVGARRLNGTLYVIAVNASREPVEVAIRARALGSRNVQVYEEGRRLRARRGVIRDRFEPLEVHIYTAGSAS